MPTGVGIWLRRSHPSAGQAVGLLPRHKNTPHSGSIFGAAGGTRTLNPLRGTDFESVAYTIPPPRQTGWKRVGTVTKTPCQIKSSLIYSLPFTRRGWVAQLVEHRTHKPAVAGSIPAPATKNAAFERCFCLTLFPFFGILPSQGRAAWQLVGLITRRSLVQIQSLQPKITPHGA